MLVLLMPSYFPFQRHQLPCYVKRPESVRYIERVLQLVHQISLTLSDLDDGGNVGSGQFRRRYELRIQSRHKAYLPSLLVAFSLEAHDF